MGARYIFLDRDGTINAEVCYLSRPEQVELLPGAAEGIKLLRKKGFYIIIVTNQSGIARGYFSESELSKIHDMLLKLLTAEGAFIDDIIYCPHHPQGKVPQYAIKCDCRKPKTGMLVQAMQKYNIDLTESYVIGDKLSDVELAKNAGCKAILVRTGYGKEIDVTKCNADNISPDLLCAAQWVI